LGGEAQSIVPEANSAVNRFVEYTDPDRAELESYLESGSDLAQTVWGYGRRLADY
jgi:hypothetical protein